MVSFVLMGYEMMGYEAMFKEGYLVCVVVLSVQAKGFLVAMASFGVMCYEVIVL